jgi:hypothetical protein
MITYQPTKDIRTELERLNEENSLMRKLATTSGFFEYYFKQLGVKKNGSLVFRTNVECFNYVNEKYFSLFGEYKYSYYGSFKQVLYRQHKK